MGPIATTFFFLAFVFPYLVAPAAIAPTAAPSCGVPSIKPIINSVARIRGGNEAVRGSWPWQVRVGLLDRFNRPVMFVCGGTIISEYYVLTAAHCIQQQYLNSGYKYFVRVGDHSTDDTETAQKDHRVQELKVHTQFNSSIYGPTNDIALMRLSTKLTFSSSVSPACLPAKAVAASLGRTCVVTGWGNTVNQTTGLFRNKGFPLVNPSPLKSGDPIVVSSKVLKQAVQSIFAQTDCAKFWRPLQIHEHMICSYQEDSSWSSTGHGEPCQGDSGGPLACQSEGTDDKWIVQGVVSFGVGCGLGGPTVYTRVSKFIEWIETNMKEL